tara:strand:+ start:114 stop:485 length:372 start_codon:yes stop_codon:yes gene_type:complete
MKAALDQGEIPKKIKAIPISKLIRDVMFLSTLFIPTENIIRGILNKRTIIDPIEKFVLFNKFIEAEIEPKHDKINDPIIKVKIKLYISFIGRLNKILTMGKATKKGICTNIKCENIFKITINS